MEIKIFSQPNCMYCKNVKEGFFGLCLENYEVDFNKEEYILIRNRQSGPEGKGQASAEAVSPNQVTRTCHQLNKNKAKNKKVDTII